jgi:hypothetical protein
MTTETKDSCETCDRPFVADEVRDHGHRCECEHCAGRCFAKSGTAWCCDGEPVDWRQRALEAERRARAAGRLVIHDEEGAVITQGAFNALLARHKEHNAALDRLQTQLTDMTRRYHAEAGIECAELEGWRHASGMWGTAADKNGVRLFARSDQFVVWVWEVWSLHTQSPIKVGSARTAFDAMQAAEAAYSEAAGD